MTEKTKRKNDMPRSRRRLAVGLATLLVLLFLMAMSLTSLVAQSDPTGHLYYDYTLDPTTDAFYRVDFGSGPGEVQAWPIEKATTVGYQAPPATRNIARHVVWQNEGTGKATLIIKDAADTTLDMIGPFFVNVYRPIPNASYSPDGQWFVFSAFNEATGPNDYEVHDQDLWLVNLETSNYKRLTENTYDDRNPTFMMDGESLLYLSESDGTRRLYTMNVAFGSSSLIAADFARIYSYEWSPDDRLILIAAQDQEHLTVDLKEGIGGNSLTQLQVLSVLNPNTGVSRKVVLDAIYAYLWSPDSQWIAYATYDPMETLETRSYGGIMGAPMTPYYDEAPSSLWIVRTDGTDTKMINGTRLPLKGFDWIP